MPSVALLYSSRRSVGSGNNTTSIRFCRFHKSIDGRVKLNPASSKFLSSSPRYYQPVRPNAPIRNRGILVVGLACDLIFDEFHLVPPIFHHGEFEVGWGWFIPILSKRAVPAFSYYYDPGLEFHPQYPRVKVTSPANIVTEKLQ